MFVWFIKEKGLVADDLFIENRVAQLLKDYDRDGGDSYYRAVLQNLFFATLNTEISERRFSQQNNDDHRNFSVYRYRSEMDDPDRLLELFAQTPFINGGLFDCLDSFDAAGKGGVRIDCFTDNARHRVGYSIPNRLFFGDGGLITLFERYKFTVEENTPAEQEVALDPELLGSVFENLLAAYNPETRETARKQTGSYYTPRPVVDYMVDEALVESLAVKVQPTPRPGRRSRDSHNRRSRDDGNPSPAPDAAPTPDDEDREFLRERLRYLLDYEDAFDDASDLFDDDETYGLVRAISSIRVLDPAVGSGAFPMGVLHKLTLALRRLDPHNTRWRDLQKELAGRRATAAFDTRDQQERDTELAEISDTFERYRDSDFGRKLCLVQNSIFGVDIQPVACQIAKLRFFISLAIEQEPDPGQANFGIKPLPNLETRFVAANTLLGVGEPVQIPLGGQNRLTELNDRLRENRERHFHAGARREKLKIRDDDKRLRGLLEKELVEVGMDKSNARKVSDWDPYDQNDNAGWFDPEYMFGVTEGFDVVIGNPPYIQLQKDGGKLGSLYKDAGYETFVRTGDIYQLFYENGAKLLAKRGLLSYITSNSWLRAEYGKTTRRYFSEGHSPIRLLEMGKDVFENAIVDTSILLLRSGKSRDTGRAVDMDRLPNKSFPPAEELWGELRLRGERPWSALSATEQPIMDKMESVGTPLKEWDVNIYRGVTIGYNQAFIIDDVTRDTLIAADPNSADIIKPVLRGRDIQRYRARWANLYLIDTHNGYGSVPAIDIDDYPAIKSHLDGFYPQLERRYDKGKTPYNLRNCAFHEEFAREKLVWLDLVEKGRFAYDDSGMFCEATSFILTGKGIKYLCALLNARLIRWFLQRAAPTSGMGTLRWKKVYVEAIPIPKITPAKQRPFVRLVDRILSAKAAALDTNTNEQEAEIDRQVYNLYGLTENEIAAVEGRSQ